jgi:hypothetical protein
VLHIVVPDLGSDIGKNDTKWVRHHWAKNLPFRATFGKNYLDSSLPGDKIKMVSEKPCAHEAQVGLASGSLSRLKFSGVASYGVPTRICHCRDGFDRCLYDRRNVVF